jgi:fatty acid desaturase
MTVSHVPGPPAPLQAEERAALRRLAPQIRELSEPSPVPLLAAGLEWVTLALLVGSTFVVEHPLWWAAVVVLIGARQHGLLVLMHEGVHWRLHRDPRLNDLLSDLFCAWPLFASTAAYRAGHLRHHRALHTPRDPDWVHRHARPEWAFPTTRGALLLRLVRVALGGGVMTFLRYRHDVVDPSPPARRLARVAVALVLPAAALLAGEGERLLLLWVLPLAVAVPVYSRLRVIAEHYGLPSRTELDTTRDWSAGVLLDWWLVPWNIRLHLTHHLFPSVPFHRLPDAQRVLLSDPVLGRRCHVTRGAQALLSELTGGRA